MRKPWTRRDFLKASAMVGGVLLSGCSSEGTSGSEGSLERGVERFVEGRKEESGAEMESMESSNNSAEDSSGDAGSGREASAEKAPEVRGCDDPFAGGQKLGVVPFVNEGGRPMDKAYGEGWDGRLYTDLSDLEPEDLIIPNDEFFIRTRYPDQLDPTKPWSVSLGGLVEKPVALSMSELAPLVKPMGAVLLECSGNGRAGKFGLLGAARWSGIPVEQVFARVKPKPEAARILISGFDKHSTPSSGGHSKPGASWIFTLEQLQKVGAFFATKMNGVSLPKDHGFPIRLIVPRWYGCTNIKWVDEIRWVGENEPATSQMQEFASRTHQVGVPRLARQYRPASIDQAAMPLRVEKWSVDGKIRYKVVGILWGGETVSTDLVIRFKKDEEYKPVEVCPVPQTNNTWSMWSYAWEPSQAGTYHIQMQIRDATIPKKRLDSGFYIRQVTI